MDWMDTYAANRSIGANSMMIVCPAVCSIAVPTPHTTNSAKKHLRLPNERPSRAECYQDSEPRPGKSDRSETIADECSHSISGNATKDHREGETPEHGGPGLHVARAWIVKKGVMRPKPRAEALAVR